MSTSMARFTPKVRVAIVGPDYAGFADLFRLDLTPAPAAAQLNLPRRWPPVGTRLPRCTTLCAAR